MEVHAQEQAATAMDPQVTRRDEAVFAIALHMLDEGLRAMPVVDEEGQLLGLVTEQDCVEAVVRAVHHRLPPSTAEDVMTEELVTVSPNQPLMSIAMVFHRQPVSVLPVVEEGRCIGMISREQCLRRALDVFEDSEDYEQAVLYLSAVGRQPPV